MLTSLSANRAYDQSIAPARSRNVICQSSSREFGLIERAGEIREARHDFINNRKIQDEREALVYSALKRRHCCARGRKQMKRKYVCFVYIQSLSLSGNGQLRTIGYYTNI